MQQYPGWIPQQPVRLLTKKEYLSLPENKKFARQILSAAMLGYFSAGVTLIVSVIIGGAYTTLADVLILFGLSLSLHLSAGVIWAVLLAVYGACSFVFTIVATGQIGGWIPLVAGVLATVLTVQLDKAWKAYKQQQTMGGNYPPYGR